MGPAETNFPARSFEARSLHRRVSVEMLSEFMPTPRLPPHPRPPPHPCPSHAHLLIHAHPTPTSASIPTPRPPPHPCPPHVHLLIHAHPTPTSISMPTPRPPPHPCPPHVHLLIHAQSAELSFVACAARVYLLPIPLAPTRTPRPKSLPGSSNAESSIAAATCCDGCS